MQAGGEDEVARHAVAPPVEVDGVGRRDGRAAAERHGPDELARVDAAHVLTLDHVRVVVLAVNVR